MANRMPIEVRVNTSDDPPKLMKGRGTPVVGMIEAATHMLINACSTMVSVMPAAATPEK